MDEGPRLFIGHRHADSEIARALAAFIRTSTAGLVSVDVSSGASFEGPRVGKSFNDELKMALERASVFVLVYTDAAADWNYTMWEAGVATAPGADFSTRLVLLQCGPDPPAFFDELVVVDARDRESIGWFVRDLLTAPDFFPERVEAITAFRADSGDINEWGTRLFEELASVLPIGTQARQFRTTPFVRLGVDAADVQRIREGDMEAEDLLDACTVLEVSDPRVFGRSLVDTRFGNVYRSYRAESAALEFFDSIAEQVVGATRERFLSSLKRAPYEGDQARRSPFINSVKVQPGGNYELDLCLVPFADTTEGAGALSNQTTDTAGGQRLRGETLPDAVFVCYSRRDKDLVVRLADVLRIGLLNTEIWSDQEIEAGDEWREQIHVALDRATAAVLALSIDFLTSDFIGSVELPRLLQAHQEGRLKVFWFKAGEVPRVPSEVERFQAALDPKHVLASVSAAQQDILLSEIARNVGSALARSDSPT